jgi:hemerythrin-like domain-containing protein
MLLLMKPKIVKKPVTKLEKHDILRNCLNQLEKCYTCACCRHEKPNDKVIATQQAMLQSTEAGIQNI